MVSYNNVFVRPHDRSTETDPPSDENVFQGDIILTESQRNKIYYGDDDGPPFKNAKDNARWPDGIIPYEISSNNVLKVSITRLASNLSPETVKNI